MSRWHASGKHYVIPKYELVWSCARCGTPETSFDPNPGGGHNPGDVCYLS